MQPGEFKIVICRKGACESRVLKDSTILKKWVKADLQIGSACQYESAEYVITGGTTRDGTPMLKCCAGAEYRRIRLHAKVRNRRTKVRKRCHGRCLSVAVSQVFLRPAK